LYQNDSRSIAFFMRSLITKYVKYFNTRYHRVGHLFQGRYKAVTIDSNDQLLYVSKYIHLNPVTTSRTVLEVSQYSSYRNYLNIISQSWVKPEIVLDYLALSNPGMSYETYVSMPEDEDETDDDFKDSP